MKIGIGSFAFGWAVRHASPPMDETGVLAFATRHGVGVAQLGDNLPVHQFSAERLAALVTAAADAGVALELGARGLTDAHLERYLRLCAVCECRLLRFVVDQQGYAPPVRDLRALLRNVAPALEAAGVTLAIENHDRFPARVLRTLVDELASPRLGICLDTANSLGAGEGLEYVTDLLAPVTVNLHVKDVAISRLPHQMGFLIEGRPLGEGMLPIQKAIDRVSICGRCESVILEAWTPPGGDLEATIRAEASSAGRSIDTLKRWTHLA